MVLGDIGMARGDQPLDHRPHLADMLGGPRLDGRRQATKRGNVLVKLLFGFVSNDANGVVQGKLRVSSARVR